MIKKTILLWVKWFLAISPFAGISDVLTPMAPFGLYIIGFLVVLLLLSLIFRIVPTWNAVAEKHIATWYLPFSCVLITLCFLMFGAFTLSKSAPDNAGFLASKFEVVGEMQSDLKIIKTHLVEITVNIDNIEENLEVIENPADDNPRKKLAALNIPWTAEAFDDAIRTMDLPTITLFLDGGMSANSNIEQAHNGILWLIGRDHPLKGEVFELLLGRGLDPNLYSETMYSAQLDSVLASSGRSAKAKSMLSDFEGSCLAAMAKFKNDTEVLELLVKYGLNEENLP